MASLRSNVHPAAASDPLGTYGSPVPNSLMGGGGGDSGSPGRSLFASPITDAAVSSLMEGMSASDLSARARARGVLQSYARERQRVVELEAEIGKANNQLAQNDALISSLRKEVHDTAFSHSEEVRSLHTMRAEVERRVSALEQELEDASAGFSRKLSEVMAQNRVKEQEVIHFETQLQRSNDESKRLRAELGRQLGYDDEGHEQDGSSPHQGGTRGIRAKELEAAQQRAVALAKKLIDAERGKREAEEALLEDRHHSQGALRTIENLRQQLADAHSRLTKEAGARRGDEQYYRGALEQMRTESEKQRQAYQEALLTAGERPLGSSPAPAGGTSTRRGRSPSVNSSIVTSADDGGDGSSSASLRARLKAAGEQIAYLADQTDRRQQEIEALSEALAKERAGRIDDHSALSTAARDSKEDLRRVKRDLVSVKAERSAAMRMIGDLKTLYERLLTPNSVDASPVWSDEQLMVDVLYELRKIGTPLVVFERRAFDGSDSDREGSARPPPPAAAAPVAAQAAANGDDNVEERLRREMASLRSYHKKEVALMQEALKESQRGRVINALERATGIVTTPRRNGNTSATTTPLPQSSMPAQGSESGDALESENSRGGSIVEEAKEWKEAFYHSEQVKRGVAQEVSQLRSEAARMRAFLKERDGRSQLSPAYLDDHDEMVEGSPLSSHYPSPRKGAHRQSASPPRHTPRRRSSVESHTTNPHQDRSPSNRSVQYQGVMGLVPSRNQVSAATERLLAEDAQASLKDHIATLHRYIVQLEQQAESDQSELERLRHRYHLLEMHHDSKFVQVKKEHAHEVQGLLRSLTEIREEYGDMMKRRQHLYNPTHTDADHSEDKHRYYHGTGGGTGLATGAEAALERRLDALISSNERQLASSYRVTSGNGTPTSSTHHSAPPPPARSTSPPLPTHTHYVTPTGVPASRTNSVASNPSYPPHHHTRDSRNTTPRSANNGGFVMRSP